MKARNSQLSANAAQWQRPMSFDTLMRRPMPFASASGWAHDELKQKT